jgi:adenylate kinase family enzyme
MTQVQAILLLGPTGSGKTPLGDWLQAAGLAGQRCVHFDFGGNLRQVVAENRADAAVSLQDLAFLRGVLATGALLEDEQFPLAERILRRFLHLQAVDAHTWVLLNGLPRHPGQAAAVSQLLDVRAVVHLACSAQTVVERIRRDTGGDRAARNDDDRDAIRRKLTIYAERTALLLEFYRSRSVPVITVGVTAEMTPRQMSDKLLADWSALPTDTDDPQGSSF